MTNKPKQHPMQKFIDRLAESQGFWKCTACGSQHRPDETVCPYCGVKRDVCEYPKMEVK